MKLKWRLDLNTIVLILLIVLFSYILYLYFRRACFVEGFSTEFDGTKSDYTSQYTTLQNYITNQKKYSDTGPSYWNTNKTITDETSVINDRNLEISINNSSTSASIFPNVNTMNIQLQGNITKLIPLKTSLDTAASAFANKNLGLISTDDITFSNTSYSSNIGKMNGAIEEQRRTLGVTRQKLIDMLTFTIGATTAGDGIANIPIIQSVNAQPLKYTITSNPKSVNSPTIIMQNLLTTPFVFKGLTNNTKYTFTVEADYSNSLPTSLDPWPKFTSTSNSIVPRPKPSVTVVGGTGRAIITVAPNKSDPQPNSYTITYSNLPPINATTATQTITNLTNNTAYTFSVVANYSDGSKTEPTSVTITPRPQPTIEVLDKDKSVQIVIRASAETGDKPVSYTITELSSSIPSQTISDISNAFTFKGLKNGSTYKFSVVANYADGSKSDPSLAVPITLKQRPAPTISASPGNNVAYITITAPTLVAGLSPTNYTLTSYPSTSSTPKTINAGATTISGLMNGKTYTFSVFANYSDGSKSDSVSAVPITLKQRPAPTITAIAGDKSATIRITAPTVIPGLRLTNYTLTSSPSTSSTPKTVNAGPITISGLTNGTTYTFSVFANYSDGSKSDSVSAVPITLKQRPAPTITAIAGDKSATIRITAPTVIPGLRLTNYTLTSSPSTNSTPKTTTTGATQTIPINGLTNGKKYTFSVIANYEDWSKSNTAQIDVTPIVYHVAPDFYLTRTNNSVTVVITNDKSDVTSYTVTAGSRTATKNSKTSYKFTGLTSKTNYTVVVVANYTDSTKSSGISKQIKTL